MNPPKFSFPDELDGVYRYYKTISGSLPVIPTQSEDNQNITTVDNEMIRHKKYLTDSIPILFCMMWDKFRGELRDTMPARHKVCFEKHPNKKLRTKYYNGDILEIILMRNCIVHCESRVSDDYAKSFPQYKQGQPIKNIDDAEVEKQYIIFRKAFERITNSDFSLLP